MEVEISSTQLNQFINKSKIIKANSILIDATDVLEVIKCDLNNQVSATINANINEPGSLEIPSDVFSLIKDDELMTITNESVKIGSRNITVNLKNGENYPRIDGDFDVEIFELNDKEVKHLLEVEHAISNDETKPILCGVRIENNRFIAIDGYRLSERIGKFKSNASISICNYKMLKSLKGSIKATSNYKYIKYQVDDYKYYDKLLSGVFIDSDKLKPHEFNSSIEVRRSELLEILNSMLKVASKKKNQLVILSIRENTLNISTSNDKLKIDDTVTCQLVGDVLDIGFNCKYLIDSIKKMDEVFKMKFTTNVNPVVIESKDKYEMILPVRVVSI